MLEETGRDGKEFDRIMPAYDYRCTACDTVFEVNRRIGETAEESCPECGGATKRLFTPVGVQFKGSGFHNTDYKPRPKESEGCSAKSDSPKCAGCPAADS